MSEKFKKIHFVGGGGVGVNALARLIIDMGCEVTASDLRDSALLRKLSKLGAHVWTGEAPQKIEGCDALVYSEAVPANNFEIARAKELGIPVLPRQDMLGKVSGLYKTCVAVAGTHGKTTVCAMLATILKYANKKFTAMIGGDSITFGNYVNNSDVPAESVFLTEACEYKRSFLRLKPHVAIITNIEHDHPDCYKTLEQAQEAFKEFYDLSETRVVPPEVLNLFATGGSIKYPENHGQNYDLYCVSDKITAYKFALGDKLALLENEKIAVEFDLPEGGIYNQKNAAAAVVAAAALGINVCVSAAALKQYAGVHRRFEKCGEMGGAEVYFDFAHHPTEIRCALTRAKQKGKALVVFQPHTYSRTRAYFDDFATVFADKTLADAVVLMPTYAAREKASDGVDSDKLASAIFDKNCKQQVYLAQNAQSTFDFVKLHAPEYDVVMFVGAGDIYDLKSKFL